MFGLVLAMGAWQYRDRLEPLMDALEPFVGSDAPPPPQRPPQRPPEPPADRGEAPPASLAALRERVGPVKLPPTPARILAAREKGTDAGSAEAAQLAEKAATADDPEALALLAEVYAERRYAPTVQAEALETAIRLAPDALATARAKAAVAWATGDLARAAQLADACLTAFPGEKTCQLWAVRALPAAMPPGVRIKAWDRVAAAWPAHRGIPRDAALLAAATGAEDARARLEAVRAKLPKDTEVGIALARVYVAEEDGDALIPLVERLGAQAPAELPLAAARVALDKGDEARVLRLLDGRAAEEMPPEVRRGIRIVAAQARYELARAAPADATRAREAFDAAGEAVALSASDPAAAQVRVLSALLVQDRATARAAWEAADRSGLAGRELARLWLTRAAQDLAVHLPRDASQAVEHARLADPRLPEAHLWAVDVAITAEDPAGVYAALRRAARDVDGTDVRRARVGGLLPVAVDPDALAAGVVQVVGGDAARDDLLTYSLAALAWLRGDAEAALGHLSPLAARDPSPEVQGLLARIHLLRGDAAAAAAAADLALASAPEPRWMLVRAQAALAAGDTITAARQLATLRSSGGAGSLALSLSAELSERAGALDAARLAAREATLADPTDRVAARLYGRLRR